MPAAERIPVLNEIGIRQLINGPIPITADGEPIIGLAPELDNFYVACGFTSGIAARGGAGRAMAHWIVDGEPDMDLWPFDVRRFGHHISGKRYHVRARGRELLAATTTSTGRSTRCDPAAAAAAARCTRRWRRPGRGVRLELRLGAAELVCAPGRRRPPDEPSFEGRPNWFEAIGREHRAVRERVALIDRARSRNSRSAGPAPSRSCSASPPTTSTEPAGIDHLHPALQRARRHRGRRHHHAARRRPLLHRHRQRLRRARLRTGSAPPAARRQRARCRRHLGARGDQSVRAAAARGAREARPTTTSATRPFPYMNAREIRHRLRAGARRCASPMSASWATSCTCRSSTRCTSTSGCGRPASRSASSTSATARSRPCGWRSAISSGAPTSRPTTTPTRPGSASAWRSTRATSSAARRWRASRRRGPSAELCSLRARPADTGLWRRSDPAATARCSASRRAAATATRSARASSTATCPPRRPVTPTTRSRPSASACRRDALAAGALRPGSAANPGVAGGSRWGGPQPREPPWPPSDG